jgi:hypothetical protein
LIGTSADQGRPCKRSMPSADGSVFLAEADLPG